MLTTIIGFISGTIIPLITKYVALKNQEKEIEIKTAYELQLQKAISDNELAKEMSITEREIAKASFNSAKNKNYIINRILKYFIFVINKCYFFNNIKSKFKQR